MRLIGKLESESDAKRLSNYLKKKGIETSVDSDFDSMTGHISYHIWAHDEDQIEEALSEFDLFLKNEKDPKYELPKEPEKETEPLSEEEMLPLEKRKPAPFTTFIIALCFFIYIINLFQEIPLLKEGFQKQGILITKVQELLLFDIPPAFRALERVEAKGSSAILVDVDNLQRSSFFRGAYDWVLLKLEGKSTLISEGPLFTSIREGQVWRSFTPAILHTSFLHILFNMIWVWILSRPIEVRIGLFRILVLSLIVGVFSNVLQYLMSGPFFIGYSGVVMGLAGFTWMRERLAPWEGYPLHKTTVLFLLIFVGGMFLLQLSSFILGIFTTLSFSPNIANTAHVSGAILGALLARCSFFDERVEK